MWQKCKAFAAKLRDRPTLPAYWQDTDAKASWKSVGVAVRLPCFSCPFKSCVYTTDDYVSFMMHVGSGREDGPYWVMISDVCGVSKHVRAIDWVMGAVMFVERANFPRVGPATTRRALRRLAQVYKDDSVRVLACFCCGQLRLACSGPPHIEYAAGTSSVGHALIEYFGVAWLQALERVKSGSLECNCGYDSWHRRYERWVVVNGNIAKIFLLLCFIEYSLCGLFVQLILVLIMRCFLCFLYFQLEAL